MQADGHIEVLQPGTLTTLQDSGRFGWRKLGIPQSGVLDAAAMRRANARLGVPMDQPVFECTLNGGTFRFSSPIQISMAGADMPVWINNREVMNTGFMELQAGDIMRIGYANHGFRSYLAMCARLLIQPVLKSHSTCLPGNFGGIAGRALQKGDRIPYEAKSPMLPYVDLSYAILDRITDPITFHPGPEWDILPDVLQQALGNQQYIIESESNRQAIVLKGEIPLLAEDIDMLSAATVLGTVQLLPDGRLVVLMHDGQTTGGYPRIGRIPEEHLWRLAQMRLGTSWSLVLVTGY